MLAKNHTVSSYFVRQHYQNAKQLGMNTQQLLTDLGVSYELVHEPRARFSPQLLAHIIRSIWEFADDELMGLSTRKLRNGLFGLIAEKVMGCKNLDEVYIEVARFYSLVTDEVTIERVEHGNDVHIRFFFADISLQHKQMIGELLLLSWHRFPSWLAGRVIPLKHVTFEYAQPSCIEEYRLMFPCECGFNADFNALVFSKKDLEAPLKQKPHNLKSYLAEIPLPWFRKERFYESFTSRVSRVLEQGQTSHAQDIGSVASQLNLSSRTLRRKLTTEGYRFQQIKDELRRDLAIHLLSGRPLSIAEIGHRVGFDEPAAFTRAFKTWTGVSPSKYRSGIALSSK